MALFEPDILNDHAVRRGVHSVPPERRLMAAILGDAIDCFRKNLATQNRRHRRLFLEAEEWIFSDNIASVFSFRNVCDVLGIDPDALRKQAAAWKQSQLREIVSSGPLPHS